MNTAINTTEVRRELPAFSVTAKSLALVALLLIAIAGAVYFGLVSASPLGFYMSMGGGALTVDPLRESFRRQS